MISRFFPAVALIVAIGLFFGYINPTRTGSIASTQAQIDSYDSALAAADRFEEKEDELIRAEANIPQEKLERLRTFLPDGVNNVQIILDLNSLAARSQITLSDFDIASSETEGGSAGAGAEPGIAATGLGLASETAIDSLEISVSATGTYEAFRTFLEGIERSLRLLDVVAVSVTDSQTGVYKYDMTIRLYWLR
ncbi:MAG TPA: hypothetical protein VF696_02140 [Candidatus Paceibacterota bacterium]|jgi:hypothetical protein